MDKLIRLTLLLLLTLGWLWGCDQPEPVVPQSEAPAAPAIAAPAAPAPSDAEHLQLVMHPAEPSAGTALYARVSGARDAVTYQWMKNDQLIDGATSSSLAVDNFAKGDTISLEVSAGNMHAMESVEIRNSPPSIAAVQFSYGSVITVQPKGEDRDGDSIGYRYQWLLNDVELFGESTETLSGELFAKGDRIAVLITPYDDETDGATVKVKDVLIENKPPLITSKPPAEFGTEEFVYAVAATDPEGEPLTYSLETAPEGMKIDASNGRVRWVIGAEVSGEQQVRIKVEDASGRWAVQEFTLTIQNPATR